MKCKIKYRQELSQSDIHLNSSKYSIQIYIYQKYKKMKKYTILLFIMLVHLASTQTCSNCKPNNCTPQGCKQCQIGFMLTSQGWCGKFTPVEGCRTYDALANVCVSCMPDRQLIDQRCYSLPENCDEVDKFRECLRCKPNFYMQRGKCLTQQISNCPPGSLAVSGFCQPLRAQNCQKLDDQKICQSCYPNYSLLNGRCLNIVSSIPCPSSRCSCTQGTIFNQNCYVIKIDRCSLKRDAIYCDACQRGFVAIDGICLEPVKIDDINCNVLAPTSDYCTGCNQDYFLNIDAFCFRNFDFNITTCPRGPRWTWEYGKCLYWDRRCEAVDFRNNLYNCIRCQEGHTKSPVSGMCERNICTKFSNGICVDTFIGYYINSTKGVNQYEVFPKNCLVVSESQTCSKCSDFTKLIQMAPGKARVCAYFDVNCVEYNKNGSCINCLNSNSPDGYTLRDRFCLKKAENCQARDPTDQSKCQVCNTGYHLEQTDKKCYIDTPGCQVYLTGSDCKQCAAQTYLLYQRKCYAVNSECIDYDANNMCRRCVQGLMPFKNICVYFHPYCIEYTDRVCSKVANGWSLGNGMTETQKAEYKRFILAGQEVKNRNTAVDVNKYSTNAGSYFNGALITRFPYANVVHTKISSVNLLGIVTGCNPGYTLINQACILKIVPNCEFYSLDEICMRCAANYTLTSNFTCVQGLNCLTPQDIENGRCKNCAKGYQLVGGQCFQLGSKDLVDQQLLQTSIFYKYTQNGLYMSWPKLANCKTQANPIICSECLPPYQIDKGLCVIPVAGCVDYGYYRGQTPGICLACQNGFVLWFGQCRRLMCNPNGAVCQTCLANYYYYFGLCLVNPQPNCRSYDNNICVLCTPGQYLNSQNQCQVDITGCLTMNRDTGRCLQCRAGIVLYRERCVNQILYCQDYDTNNRCIRCQQNSINRTQLLTDGTCGLLVGQCAKISDLTKQCSQCNLGYSPIQQSGSILCVNSKKNCINYDIRGRCTTCAPRYVLSNNQCIIYLQYCIVQAPDKSTCITCANGTQLDNGCCRVPDANCISYTQCICTGCMTKYYLSPEGRCVQNIQGCDIYDYVNKRCLKCSAQYYIMSDGTCQLQQFVTNGCNEGYNLTVSQSNQYQCVKCKEGFELNPIDKLCYGYNCNGIFQATRHCLNCPLYYKIYKANSFNDYQNYCIPYFCEAYTPGQDKCQVNSSTYYGGHIIIVVTKTITIEYCLNIDNTGKCTSCSNYRYPNPSTIYGICYPSHCLSITEFNCTKCQFGYGFDSRYPGSCVASFCNSFKPDGSCSACILPYTVSSTGICENKGCCQIYDPIKGVCQAAKKYFFIQNNICIPVNCAVYDPKLLTSCIECQRGYTLFPDGTCRVTNCQQDSFSGQSCVTCIRGFKLQYSTASTKSICIPRYCTQYAKDLNTCIQCAQGFTLDADKLCRADYCANYQSNLICQNCIPYFILNQNERCVADCSVGNTTTCQCCKFGFTLNTTSSLCQSTDQFCAKVNPSSGLCSQCVSNYNLISGKCIAPVPNCQTPSMFGCLSCRPGYDLLDSCRCVPKYCNQVGSDGKCAVCHPRFELTPEGLCMTRDCQFFSVQSWACNGCYPRFRYVDNICVTNDCRTWADFQNTTCQVCNTATSVSTTDFSRTTVIQYNLTFGACYISFCQKDPRNFYCDQCYIGYKKTTTGLCQCANYNSVNNVCICPEGYVLNKATGLCEINRDICLQRNSNGTCLQCPFQYQDPVNNGGQCVPLFCDKWELTAPGFVECRACYNNFRLVNGFCESTLCLKYDNKSGLLFPQCTQCQVGWSPYSNICVPSRCLPTTYNVQTGICITCTSFGYILSPDKKRCVVANCLIDLPPDQCAKCKLGYYNFTGLCIASNCTIFDEVTCKACVDGYVLKNQLCYAINCDNFGENNFCLKCSDGYTLAQNYTCLREYCQIDSKDKCQKCIKGYTFSNTLQRCVPVNCQKYPPKYQTCEICIPGYYKQNNTCLDIRCNLTSFTQQYKCLRCQTGFQFNKEGLCYPKDTDFCPIGKYYNVTLGACVNIPISDCRIWVNKQCLWCADGFFLYNNLCYSFRFCSKWSYYFGCYQCLPGYYLQDRQCKKYEQDPNCQQTGLNTCIKCKQGYQLWSGRCILIPSNCQQVDGDGRCIKCVPGFVVFNGVCQSSDLNCLVYNTQGKCVSCVAGYFDNPQGQCVENPVNCTIANSNGKCIQCVSGYYLQNGRCFKQSPFCQKYSETTQFCIGCIKNFTLLGIQCQCSSDSQLILNKFCIKLPSNCLELNVNTFVCIRCAKNYILTPDFRCVSNIITPPENCNIYDPATGFCKQCFPNFILNNNTCKACLAGQVQVGNQCFIIIPGCKQYLNNGACKSCVDGFKLDNNKCVQIQVPQFCDIYDPLTGICTKCSTGYNLTSSGLCVLNNCLTPSADGRTCVKCIDNFNWNGKQCQFDTQFCISYFGGRCQTCQNFATLQQSRCLPNFCNIYDYLAGFCTSCLDNYVLVSRRCFIRIIGCNGYLNTGLCRICAAGYNLVNGQCVKVDTPQFCTQYNPITGICAVCAPGYRPTSDGKLCIFVNCQAMNPAGTTCTKCTAPFKWNGQFCIFQTDFCVSYLNTTGYCTSCLNFATLQRNRCVPNFCSSYNYNIGACETCNNGYILNLSVKRCFVIIIFCVSYTDTGLCSQCSDGYMINNNGASCISIAPPVVPSCYAQSAKNCTRCRHRYYLDTQICSAYLPYCINIDPYGKCISCCFGSTLINGRCQRDTNIRFCTKQIGNTCQQCLNNYNYCAFCEACLPPSPNCNRYGADGNCAQCFDNFVLLNGICVSLPVGFVSGAAGTCRAGYYSKNGNCYKNTNELRLYSQISRGSSQLTDSYRISESQVMIIFAILITSSSSIISPNSSFILYYRSKTSDPLICWNSCIPIKIDNKNYVKELVYPIIATEVIVYLLNQNIQTTSFDFRVL